MKKANFNLSIKSIDDVTRCINLASLLELAGWPKPGNVHRTHNFKDTTFEHFLTAITAIQPSFRILCEKIYQTSLNQEKDYESIKLGLFYKNATKEMMKWQGGGNVLLGHILILSPLAVAATICLKNSTTKFNDFKYYLEKIIDKSTVQDTLNLYEAIKICNPGGLGNIEKYDVNNENSINEIKADNITLKKIFEFSKDYDLISSEYSTGFNIILTEGLPYFFETFYQFQNLNIATVNTFLKLLSIHPDTLIIRKSGIENALFVSERSNIILEQGGVSSEEGLKLTIDLDNELQARDGKLNPGTTADLLAGIIFCALIFGLKI